MVNWEASENINRCMLYFSIQNPSEERSHQQKPDTSVSATSQPGELVNILESAAPGGPRSRYAEAVLTTG